MPASPAISWYPVTTAARDAIVVAQLEIGLFAQVLDDGLIYQAVAAGTGSGIWAIGEYVDAGSDDIGNESDVDGDTVTEALDSLNVGAVKTGSGPGAPDEDTDETGGYAVGSMYVDTTGPALYFCSDATEGAAVWSLLALDAGE